MVKMGNKVDKNFFNPLNILKICELHQEKQNINYFSNYIVKYFQLNMEKLRCF